MIISAKEYHNPRYYRAHRYGRLNSPLGLNTNFLGRIGLFHWSGLVPSKWFGWEEPCCFISEVDLRWSNFFAKKQEEGECSNNAGACVGHMAPMSCSQHHNIPNRYMVRCYNPFKSLSDSDLCCRKPTCRYSWNAFFGLPVPDQPQTFRHQTPSASAPKQCVVFQNLLGSPTAT